MAAVSVDAFHVDISVLAALAFNIATSASNDSRRLLRDTVSADTVSVDVWS